MITRALAATFLLAGGLALCGCSDESDPLARLGEKEPFLETCGLWANLFVKLNDTGGAVGMDIAPESDDLDYCECMVGCRVMEQLSDSRDCSTVGRTCFEPDVYAGCLEPAVDSSGVMRTPCEVPQARITQTGCDSYVDCWDPTWTRTVSGEGWYYVGEGWTMEGGTGPEPRSAIRYTAGMEPQPDSTAFLSCNVQCPVDELGVTGSGGRVGSDCAPLHCPNPECSWDANSSYVVESEDCSGGGCLMFRGGRTGAADAYCSRRCGPSAEGVSHGVGCPTGYECYAITTYFYIDIDACYCVDATQLDLAPGTMDSLRVRLCPWG
jgi:hypothetical protein